MKAKPSSAKGVYLRKMTLSSTMGPGLKLDQASIEIESRIFIGDLIITKGRQFRKLS